MAQSRQETTAATERTRARGRTYVTRPGTRFPPGATATAEGVNFCVFSRDATNVELLLFADGSSIEPLQTIALTPDENRSFYFWHVLVEGLEPGVCYAWRADGPTDTAATGRAFDKRKLLLDPWARAVSDELWDRGAPPKGATRGARSCARS